MRRFNICDPQFISTLTVSSLNPNSAAKNTFKGHLGCNLVIGIFSLYRKAIMMKFLSVFNPMLRKCCRGM